MYVSSLSPPDALCQRPPYHYINVSKDGVEFDKLPFCSLTLTTMVTVSGGLSLRRLNGLCLQ